MTGNKVTMAFRAMTEADFDAVLTAEVGLHLFPWTYGNFNDSLKAGHAMWVATEADEMVAYAVTTQIVDEVHLLNISVLKDRQRSGRGMRVMQHLFNVARDSGGYRMLLEVRPDNKPARELYQRCGFTEIGRRKAYYPAHEGREDAIVMARLVRQRR
jgi:ribosomal-protein-alanine N-acetyltransferase